MLLLGCDGLGVELRLSSCSASAVLPVSSALLPIDHRLTATWHALMRRADGLIKVSLARSWGEHPTCLYIPGMGKHQSQCICVDPATPLHAGCALPLERQGLPDQGSERVWRGEGSRMLCLWQCGEQ